jgi:hypothetical protein
MRKNDKRVGRFVPLLRRIIIAAAIVAAVPVVLWTITEFVRAYVGPPRLPTFQQLAHLGEAAKTADDSTQPLSVPEQANLPNPVAPTVEARPTSTDARDLPPPVSSQSTVSSNWPSATAAPATNNDRPATGDAVAPTNAKVAEGALPPGTLKQADLVGAPPSAGPANIWNPVTPPNMAATTDSPTGALPSAAPLTGNVPLPRRRPSDVAMTRITVANVPMPRPRPETAGPSPAAAASAETPAAAPLGFLQNVFH